MTAVAVGGGGRGGYFSGGVCHYGSGGGSGHVNVTTTVIQWSTELDVTIGARSEPSYVMKAGQKIVDGAAGGDGGQQSGGGSGFSGGGGGGYGCLSKWIGEGIGEGK